MNITQEKTGTLTASLKIQIVAEDYQGKLDKAIRDYQKKANMPGFRPGKVPMGMIKKMVGKELLIEELNKLLSESLYDYIEDNKIEIFGEPLPNNENNILIEEPENGEYEFSFDLALKPKIEIDIENDISVKYYSVEVPEKEVDEMIENYRNRLASETEIEVAEKNDVLDIGISLNGDEDTEEENSMVAATFLRIDEKLKESAVDSLLGMTVGCKIQVKGEDLFVDEADFKAFVERTKQDISISSLLNIEVTAIKRFIPAELNPEFFDKIFPDANIEDEEALRNRMKEMIKEYRNQDSAVLFYRFTIREIVEKLNIELPDELLKRRLRDSAVKEGRDEEEMLKDYPIYANALIEQLIESYLAEKYEVKVDYEEVREEIMKAYGISAIPDYNEEMQKAIDNIVKKTLEDQKQAMRYYEQIFRNKLSALFIEKVAKEEESITLEEFLKLEEESR